MTVIKYVNILENNITTN